MPTTPRRQPKPEPTGTPQATLDQIPRTMNTISALITDPATGLGKAMWNTGRIIATSDTTTQWHLIDAAITITQTLRDTLTRLIGTPLTLTPPRNLPDQSAETTLESRTVLALIHADDPERHDQLKRRITTGQVPVEAITGAYTLACALAHQCILILAQGSGMTPQEAWKRARPLLMP